MSAQGVMQTTYCPYCSVQLSYPQGSMFIQCPKCRNTMNPQAPQHTPCHNCGTLLAHPANSICIQCPKCLFAMNARERPLQPTQTIPQTYHHYVPSAQSSNILGKTKKRKDPHAPKASSNAYMIFCKERRAKLKEDHPELPFGKLGAKLGEIWRNMPPEAKKPYEERAAMDRERYRRQMQEYALHSPHMKTEDGALASMDHMSSPAAGAGSSSTHIKFPPSSPASIPAEFSSPSFSAGYYAATASSSSHGGGGGEVSPFMSSQSHLSQQQQTPHQHHLLHHSSLPSPVQSTFNVGSASSLLGAAVAGANGLSPTSAASSVSATATASTSLSSLASMFPGTASLSLPPSTVQKLADNADMSSFMNTLRLLTGNNNLTLSSLLGSHMAPSMATPPPPPPPPHTPQTSSTLHASSPLVDHNGSTSLAVSSLSSSPPVQGSQSHLLSGIVGVSPPTFVTHSLPFGTSSMLSPLPPTAVSSASNVTPNYSPFTNSFAPSSSSLGHDFTHSTLEQHQSSSLLTSDAAVHNGSLSQSVASVSIQPPDPSFLAMANQAASIVPSLAASDSNSNSNSNSNGISFHGAVSMDLDEPSHATPASSSANALHTTQTPAAQAVSHYDHHISSAANFVSSSAAATQSTASAMLIDARDIPRIQSDTSIGSYGSLGLMDSTSELVCSSGAASGTVPSSPPSSSESNCNGKAQSPNAVALTASTSADSSAPYSNKPVDVPASAHLPHN